MFQLICSNKLIMLNKLKQFNWNIKLFNKCLILNKKWKKNCKKSWFKEIKVIFGQNIILCL